MVFQALLHQNWRPEIEVQSCYWDTTVASMDTINRGPGVSNAPMPMKNVRPHEGWQSANKPRTDSSSLSPCHNCGEYKLKAQSWPGHRHDCLTNIEAQVAWKTALANKLAEGEPIGCWQAPWGL